MNGTLLRTLSYAHMARTSDQCPTCKKKHWGVADRREGRGAAGADGGGVWGGGIPSPAEEGVWGAL